MKTIFLTALLLLVLLAAGATAFVYFGGYNVAATSSDSAALQWILRTVRERSIESNAEQVRLPTDLSLTDPHVIQVGFEHYDEMCTVCHGAPGVKPGEAHDGLNPKPPDLVDHAEEMSPEELFWVIKHGIKMTGMPAWGPTHSDTKIWAMVAFVKKLPGITPAQYEAMQKQLAQTGEEEHSHESGTGRAH